MKRKECKFAIYCNSYCGPSFGDIHINDNCNEENNWIANDGTIGYECHPQYKSSLFVNTAGSDEWNMFSVFDYEVFCNDFESHGNINKLCKYPDIIWEYIKTKDISEDSLNQVGDEQELLCDLDVIHCDDSFIRVKISNYYLKNPSKLLPNSQIVDKKYDSYLREWAGDYKWKLLYRASENGYTAQSFHECCNDKGPTLIVIKSSGGWIFGGYTSQSWNGGIYNDMI